MGDEDLKGLAEGGWMGERGELAAFGGGECGQDVGGVVDEERFLAN